MITVYTERAGPYFEQEFRLYNQAFAAVGCSKGANCLTLITKKRRERSHFLDVFNCYGKIRRLVKSYNCKDETVS